MKQLSQSHQATKITTRKLKWKAPLYKPQCFNHHVSSLCVTFFFKSSPENMFIDFRERGRGKERNTDVKEKHWSVASCIHPDWGPNPQHSGVWDDTPNNPARDASLFLECFYFKAACTWWELLSLKERIWVLGHLPILWPSLSLITKLVPWVLLLQTGRSDGDMHHHSK